MVSRTPRRTLRCLRPGSHSRFGSHLNLIAEKIAPFFSSTYVEPILQPFCFHIHACNGGVYPPPQRSDVQICKSKLNCSCGAEIPIRSGRFDVFPIYPLCFHILAHSFALFCTLQKLKAFHFKRFRTLCQKYRGWGYPPLSKRNKMKPRTANSAFYPFVAPIALPAVVRPFRLGWRKGRSERAKKSLDGLQGSDGMQLVPAMVGVVDVGTGNYITLADLRFKVGTVISAAGFCGVGLPYFVLADWFEDQIALLF